MTHHDFADHDHSSVCRRTRQFTATVQNSSNTSVIWKVNGITGGNAVVGTITASGRLSGAELGAKSRRRDGERDTGRGPDAEGDRVCDHKKVIRLQPADSAPGSCAHRASRR